MKSYSFFLFFAFVLCLCNAGNVLDASANTDLNSVDSDLMSKSKLHSPAPRKLSELGSINNINSPSKKSLTMDEIAERQIFIWTIFVLALIIFFASCALGSLDIGNDDAGLYSVFKADDYSSSAHAHMN